MGGGSYRIEAVTTVRSASLSSASAALVSGFLRGVSDGLDDQPDMLVSLAVSYQPDVPPTPLGGHEERER